MSELDHAEDHAPGDAPHETPRQLVMNYAVGLGLAVILTIASFCVCATHLVWPPAVAVAIIVLAIAQMGVHLVFFLHISTGPDNTNNVLALAFGVMVVFLIVIGSVWIMSHLSSNMAPMDMHQLMDMQR